MSATGESAARLFPPPVQVRLDSGFVQSAGDAALDHPIGIAWWVALAVSLGLCGVLAVSVGALLVRGVGLWGNNIPVTWALDIVSYDWWIGIACGSLFLSAAWHLLGVDWGRGFSRLAELIAVCAAIAAGLYPIIHLGRPWLFYWNLPYPNTLLLWPQFRSPLVWDAFDILAFLVIALSLFYIGLLPDLATLRDRSLERVRKVSGRGLLRAQIYGIAALGWRGSAVHWQRWQQGRHVLSLLAVLQVVTLQTGASVMFAGSLEPGWHDALLPASTITGALSQGVAAIAILAVILRRALHLEVLITERHLAMLASWLLGSGLLGLYCFGWSAADAWLHGSSFDRAVIVARFTGAHAWAAWSMLLGGLLPVHVFWFARLRRAPAVLATVGGLVCAGIFGDHFMTIVVTLQHDFLPASAAGYRTNLWEWATFAGTAGLFMLLVLLAVRVLPAISLEEQRRLRAPSGGTTHGL